MTQRKGEGRSTVYNHIASDEKLKQVNPDNRELEKDFLEYLSSIGRFISTVETYRYFGFGISTTTKTNSLLI